MDRIRIHRDLTHNILCVSCDLVDEMQIFRHSQLSNLIELQGNFVNRLIFPAMSMCTHCSDRKLLNSVTLYALNDCWNFAFVSVMIRI